MNGRMNICIETRHLNNILKACKPVVDPRSVREVCQYIRLTVVGKTCIATALNSSVFVNYRSEVMESDRDGKLLIPLLPAFRKDAAPFTNIRTEGENLIFSCGNETKTYKVPVPHDIDTTQLLPKHRGVYPVAMNPDLLEKALQIFRRGRRVEILVYDSPLAGFEIRSKDAQVYVAPCRPLEPEEQEELFNGMA